ncbi:AAA family ATPase [Candidatus Uhrbacteria bacterium]|jgi:thymidylate kinase|nr:AAA family ATPase [bacterium]MBT5808038.1 AAA family ATPase [Candidatus Uhrbacteria bacterium]
MKHFLLLLDGMMGSGKTTASSLLSDHLPRTAIIGMDKVKRFVSDFERGTQDNKIAREIVLAMSEKYLELGLSVVVDHPFSSDDQVASYEALSTKYSIPIFKFQLFTTPKIAFGRVNQRQEDREHKVSEERIKRNITLFEDKSNLGFKTIDTTNLQPNEVADIILETINI